MAILFNKIEHYPKDDTESTDDIGLILRLGSASQSMKWRILKNLIFGLISKQKGQKI